jgi:hypothetical protein
VEKSHERGLPKDADRKSSKGSLHPSEVFVVSQDYLQTFLKHKKGRRNVR